MINKAMKYAMKAHDGQFRKHSNLPYFVHCMEVMKKVSDYGIRNENILCASLLHDVHEDSPEYSNGVVDEFGYHIHKIMIECSRPERDDATKEQKYNFLCSFEYKSIDSIIIKIADRYCNVMDYLNTKGKEEYASTYALQAYPIYESFVHRVKYNDIELNNDIIRNVLFDIIKLKKIAEKYYPMLENLTTENIKRFVI